MTRAFTVTWSSTPGALEDPAAVFQMTSRYLLCEIGDELGQPRPDDYERQLGLYPVWISAGEALRAHEAAGPDDAPP